MSSLHSLLQPDKTKLDFRNYAWIGSISEDVTTCYLWRDGGPKSIAELKAGGQYRFGSAGIGTSDDINTKILRRVFGVDIQFRDVGDRLNAVDKALAS